MNKSINVEMVNGKNKAQLREGEGNHNILVAAKVEDYLDESYEYAPGYPITRSEDTIERDVSCDGCGSKVVMSDKMYKLYKSKKKDVTMNVLCNRCAISAIKNKKN